MRGIERGTQTHNELEVLGEREPQDGNHPLKRILGIINAVDAEMEPRGYERAQDIGSDEVVCPR